jgi:hypothetical protein
LTKAVKQKKNFSHMSSCEDSLIEDIHPVISSSSAIPSAILRLRRCPDVEVQGKRRLMFRDPQGVPIEVDEMLLEAPVGSDQDSECNPFDDEALSKVDANEQLMRGIKAASIVAHAKATKNATTGSRRLAKVIANQMLTTDDAEEQLEKDIDGLRWVPVVSPMASAVNSWLREEPIDTSDCYGCSRGIGVQRVEHKKITELRNIIMDIYPTTEPNHACRLIENWFEEHIRQPANRRLQKGMQPIQRWPAEMIYQHIEWHMNEPTFIKNRLLRDAQEHYRIVLMREVYRVPIERVRPGTHITPADYRIRREGDKLYDNAVKRLKMICDWNPKAAVNFNPKFNLSEGTTTIVMPKAQPLDYTKMASIFTDVDTGV